MKQNSLLAILSAVALVLSAEAKFAPSPALARNRLQLYVLMGRSDMAERDVGRTPVPRYGMLDAAGVWSDGLVAYTLGESLAASGPIHWVGLLPCAQKGSAAERWLPGGDLYAAALARVREGMKKGFPTAVVWLPDDEAKDESATLLKIMTQLRKDLAFGEVRVAIGEYGSTAVGDAVAAKLSNTVAVPLVRGDAKASFDRLADALKGSVDATVTSVVSPLRAFADGRELHVNAARLSAFPMNQEWPGYQRPIDQTKIGYFASFPVDGKSVTFALDIPGGVPQDLRIRPLGVTHPTRVEGDRLYVTVTKPEQFVIECGAKGPQFHVFADPPFRYEHVRDEIYFGPGEHDAGIIAPKSGQTVCIDEGAVVYGTIYCLNVKDVRIVGRGILDASKLHRGDKKSKAYAFCRANGFDTDATARVNCCFTANNSSNVSVEGITMRDSCRWTMLVWRGSSQIHFDNVKIIGQWRYCTDGLDVWGCRGVTVRNSFIRSFDDCIVARGVPGRTTGDYLVENSVLWCDWGKSLEVISDGGDCDFENILFRNNRLVDVNSSGCTLSIMGARAGTYRNILYKDNEVDVCEPAWHNQLQRMPGEKFGFKSRHGACAVNIFATSRKDGNGKDVPGYPDGRKVRLENVVVDGVKVYGEKANVTASVWNKTDYQDFSGVVLTNLDACIKVKRDIYQEKSDAEKNFSVDMNRMGKAAYEEGGKGGPYRVLIYGNSFLKHRPLPSIGWTNDWGMAASCREKDFAHLLLKKMEVRLGAAPDYRLRSLYWFEKDFPHFDVARELAGDIAYKPDYLIVAIGENVGVLREKADQDLYRARLIELVKAFQADGRTPRVIVRAPAWPNETKSKLMLEAAQATGARFVDCGQLKADKSNLAIGLFKHPGVQMHPGDKGMAVLADLIGNQLFD